MEGTENTNESAGSRAPEGQGHEPPATGSLSRRRFLGAVVAAGGTIAAGTVLWRALSDEDDDDGSAERGTADPTRNAAGFDTETRTLHLHLPGSGYEAPGLYVIGQRYELVPHDTASRTKFLQGLPGGIDAGTLTHYVEAVALPGSVVQALVLDGMGPDDKISESTRYLGTSIHVPGPAMQAHWQQVFQQQKAVAAIGTDPAVRQTVAAAAVGKATLGDVRAALAASGASGGGVALLGTQDRWSRLGGVGPATPEEAMILRDLHDTPWETAVTYMMKHPEIACLDPNKAPAVLTTVQSAPATTAFADVIRKKMASQGASLGSFIPVVDDTGAPVLLPGGFPDVNGQTVEPAQPFHMELDTAYNGAIAEGVLDCLQRLKAAPGTEGVSWAATSSTPTVEVPAENGAASLGGTQVQGLGATTKVALSGECVGGRQSGITAKLPSDQPSSGTVSLELVNDYLRHVQVGVSFQDAFGKGVPVGSNYGAEAPFKADWWPDVIGIYVSWMPDASKHSSFFGPLKVVDAAPTLLGVPLPGVSSTTFDITFPPNASVANVFVMGIGLGNSTPDAMRVVVDNDGKPVFNGNNMHFSDIWLAVLLTAIVDFVFPIASLLWDLNVLSKEGPDTFEGVFKDAITVTEEKEFSQVVEFTSSIMKYMSRANAAAVGVMFGGGAVGAAATYDLKDDAFSTIRSLALPLLQAAKGQLAQAMWTWVMKRIATDAALKSIPFMGEAIAVVSAVAGAAQVGFTTAELVQAAKVHTFSLRPTYTTTLTITPDDGSQGGPGDAALPRTATSFVATYRINGEPTGRIVTGPVSSGVDSLVIEVADVPIGGTIRWDVTLLSKEGWTVGTAASAYLTNSGDPLPAKLSLKLKEVLYTLSSESTYNRQVTTTQTATGLQWKDLGAIGGTVSDLTNAPASSVTELDGVSVSTRQGMVGYVWQTGGRWWARNLSVLTDAGSASNLAGPFDARPFLIYDSLSADPAGALNFLLDPVRQDDQLGYFVRQVKATKGSGLGIDRNTSFGFFPAPLDDAAFHPNGYLVGVSTTTSKLYVLKLPPAGTAPSQSALALQSGGRDVFSAVPRDGLFHAPILVTTMPQGPIVVLDVTADGLGVLKAFGLDGNPVPIFTGDTSTLVLDDSGGTATYVGLSCDGGGTFSILSYQVEDDPSSWTLDVRQKNGEQLFTVPGVNAGRHGVDYWRNAYTLNYAQVVGGDGAAAIDPAVGGPEPSISAWIPSTPKP